MRFPKVSGFVYGNQTKNCFASHLHSRECSKARDLDLAHLQSLAFQFMLL